MKKQQWQVLVFLTLLLAAASAVGETNRGDLNVNIPFAFVVGNQTLPPGHYVVTRFNDSTLRFYNSQRQDAFVPTHGVEGKALESAGKMIFHRYGNTYFLFEVWSPAKGTGRQVFTSWAEEELARQGTEKQVAVLRIAQ
jgi:hypothetical protein